MIRHRRFVPFLAAIMMVACQAPDPKQEVEVLDLETYWAVDASRGDTQFIAPVVRFRLRNKGAEARRSIQATASFRREGDSETWSSAFSQAAPVAGKPLDPGASITVVLKPEGEGRYRSTGSPESMFAHQLFKDVRTEVFVRVGSSGWVKFAEAKVERRIGTRSVETLPPTSAPPAVPGRTGRD